MQVVRMIKWFNWDWWLNAVYEVHAFVDTHITATYKEIETRKARIAAGEKVGPEREDLLWYTASHDSDYEDLRSQLALLLVPNNDTNQFKGVRTKRLVNSASPLSEA
jgi:cytochrome P450 monooxygenase